jgi:hypothetical protein
VDARGDEQQRRAIADIFTGRLGGTPCKQFPWVFKAADLVGVEALDIEIDHTPGRGWFKAAGRVAVHVREPVADQETVTCIIAGHHRQGRELLSDSISVDAGALAFSVKGRCAYETTFDYSSEDRWRTRPLGNPRGSSLASPSIGEAGRLWLGARQVAQSDQGVFLVAEPRRKPTIANGGIGNGFQTRPGNGQGLCDEVLDRRQRSSHGRLGLPPRKQVLRCKRGQLDADRVTVVIAD